MISSYYLFLFTLKIAKAWRNEPYEDRCRLLNWQSLEKRRKFLSFVQCYKIVFGIDSLQFSDILEFTKCNRNNANHDYKLYLKLATRNFHKNSFFVRIVKECNDLPKNVVHAGVP